MYKTKINTLELEIRKQVDMAAEIQEDKLMFAEHINRLEQQEQLQLEALQEFQEKERDTDKELDTNRENMDSFKREYEGRLADEGRKILKLEREIENKMTEIVYLEQKSKNLEIVHEIQKVDITANESRIKNLEELEANFNALKADFENVSLERDKFMDEKKSLDRKNIILWDDFNKESSLISGLKRENLDLTERVKELETASRENRKALASMRNSALPYEMPNGFALSRLGSRQGSIFPGQSRGNPMFSHMGTREFKDSVRSRMDKTSVAFGGWSNKGSITSRLAPNFTVTPTQVRDSIPARPPIPRPGQFKSNNIQCMEVVETMAEEDEQNYEIPRGSEPWDKPVQNLGFAQQQSIRERESETMKECIPISAGESELRDSEPVGQEFLPSDILLTFMPDGLDGESAKPSINRANFRQSVQSMMMNGDDEQLKPEDLGMVSAKVSIRKMTGRWANEVMPFAEKISMKMSTRLGMGEAMNKESVALVP